MPDKQQTAMQELIEYLENHSMTNTGTYWKATSLLPRERERDIHNILLGLKFFGVDITTPENIKTAQTIFTQNYSL